MNLSIQNLNRYIVELLLSAGLEQSMAVDVADIFVRATLRGVGHHDLSYLPQRLEWLTGHGVNPRPLFKLLRNFGATEVWDGDCGLGEAACRHATLRSIELAKVSGIGFATIGRSNHFLAASPYAEMGQEQGFMTLVLSNTDPGMGGPGGNGLLLGNNPLGFSVPRAKGEAPLLLDLCMAYSSLGNLQALKKTGTAVPEYWGRNAHGQSTNDPAQVLEGGTVEPMAGYKGFGLALMNEALTGILSGGHYGHHVTPGGGINTHNQTVIALDLRAFGGAEWVANRMEDLVKGLKEKEPNLRIPGERSFQAQSRQREEGIEIPESLWSRLEEWKEKLKDKF